MDEKIKLTANNPNDNLSRGFVGFVVFIAVLGAFSSLVNDMYLPTMPAMKHEFHTTTSMTQMGLAMAMLGMGIGSVLLGSLSDHYGRKPVLIISMAIFVVATAVCLLSRSIVFFIVCRLFQGFGAGGPMVLSTSIPADDYQGRQLAKVMAIVGAINGIAPALGPLVGGFLSDSIGWRGIFLVLLVVGLVMGYFVLRMKESLPASRRTQSTSLSSYLKSYKILLANKRFMLYVLLKAIGIALLYAYISSAPFIFQEHYGFSATHFGLIFGANAIAIAVGSTLVMKFKRLKQGLLTGTVGMIAFALIIALIMYHSGRFIYYELATLPMLVFSGMIFAGANTLAMDVGRDEAGTASALLSIIKYLLAALVSPLVGLGNIMHSGATAYIACAIVAAVLFFPISRLAPLSDMTKN